MWVVDLTYQLAEVIDLAEQLRIMRESDNRATVGFDEDDETLTITLDVESTSPGAALAAALEIISHTRLPGGELVDTSATTYERSVELARRNITLDLIGYAEAAPILGITRQGVRYLAEHDKSFPEPVGRPAIGPVYMRSHIEAYSELRSKQGD